MADATKRKKNPLDTIARDLTSAGHEFLGALKSEDAWNQVKAALSPEQPGSMPLRTLARIAGDLLEKYLCKKLGL